MTILTASTCGFIVTSSGHTIPAAVGTLSGALVTGAKLYLKSESVNIAISTAIGTGSSSGAIAGAVVSKTAMNAAAGAVVGGLAAGAVGSVIAGSLAVASSVLATSPLGLLTVGTSPPGPNCRAPRYDCWKAVVRDTSSPGKQEEEEESSSGMSLRDMVNHPNVANVTITSDVFAARVVLDNVWGEQFEIQYVVLEGSDQVSLHANPL